MSINFTKAALALSVAASIGAANAATVTTYTSGATTTSVSLEQSQTAASIQNAKLPLTIITLGKNLVAGNSVNVTLDQGSFTQTGNKYFLSPISTLKSDSEFARVSATAANNNKDLWVGGSAVGRQVSFTVNSGKSVNAGSKFLLHTSTDAGFNGLGYGLSVGGGAQSSIMITAFQQGNQLQAAPGSLTSVGQKVTLSVDDGASSSSVTAFVAKQQLSAKVSVALDATIDVVDGRKTFLNKAKSDSLSINVTNDTTLNGTTYNPASDKFTFTLFGNMAQIKSITSGTKTLAVNATKDSAAITHTGFADQTYVLNVSGTAPLNADVFTASLTGDLTGTPDVTLLSKAAAGQWTINGLQAKVSQMALNATGFVSWLKIVNESTQDAGMEIDIQYTKADGTSGKVVGKTLKATNGNTSVKPGEIVTIGEAQILEAMGMTSADGLMDIAATVTVVGPINSVNLIAEKKAPDGRVSIPVYYNKSTRNWVQ